MTRDIKYLVLALAVATGAVAPPSLRGVKDASGAETVGDTFEMSLAKAVAKDDATLAVTPKLRGAADGHRPAGRGLDFAYYQTDEPTAEPTKVPTAEPSSKPTAAPTAEPTVFVCPPCKETKILTEIEEYRIESDICYVVDGFLGFPGGRINVRDGVNCAKITIPSSSGLSGIEAHSRVLSLARGRPTKC